MLFVMTSKYAIIWALASDSRRKGYYDPSVRNRLMDQERSMRSSGWISSVGDF